MSSIAAARIARPAPTDTSAPRADAPRTNESLLPAPTGGPGVVQDAMTLLYKLTCKNRDANGDAANNQQKITAAERKEQSRKMSEALDKQVEAGQGKGFFKQIVNLCVDAIQVRPDLLIKKTLENCKDIGNDPKFWKDLAKGAMTVAKIAAAVVCVAGIIAGPGVMGTLGFAIAVFSACAMLEGELKIMERLGVDAKIAGNVRLGVAVATVLVSFGNLATAGSQAVSSATAQGANVSKLQQGVELAGKAARTIQPAAETSGRAAMVGQKVHERRAENFFADSETHRFDKEATDRRLKAQIRDAITAVETDEKTLGLLKQAMLTQQQSTLSLASAIGGRA